MDAQANTQSLQIDTPFKPEMIRLHSISERPQKLQWINCSSLMG